MEEEDYEELIVPPNFENYSRSSSDEIQINNCDILNYKGYFVDQEQNDNDDDTNEQRFYEFGAHFPYYFLVQKLEILKLEYEQKEKKQHNIPINNNNNNNLLDGIKLKQNGRSRNRNVNFGIQSDNAHIIDRFSAITKDKINNDEKTKQPNHDAMSMILKDSITTNNHIDNENKELNTKTEIIATHKHINKTNDDGNSNNNNNNNMKMSNGTTNNKSVKAYTSFANKLKEAKRCNNNNNNNISNTGRNYHNATNIPIRKNSTQINGNNNHNVINNNMKNNNTNKTVQVANDKTRNNNFRECGALSQNITSSKQKNKLEKKIKHTSNSANNNNNNKNINEDGNNCKNKQGDINRTKSKEFSASSNNNNNNNNLHNAKITNSINNLLTSYKYKRNIHFSPGLHPQPTKITQKGINISNINNNNNNNIPPNNKTSTQVKILTKNKIQDFITSLNKTSKQKSRNCNTNNPTVNTILKNNNNNRTILTSHTKLNAQTDREKPQQLIPLTNDKARSASNKVKNTKGKVKSNKYKTYIDLKFNVFNKTNQQIINEIKKKLENNPNEHQHVNPHSKNTNTSKTKTSSKSKTTKSHKVLKSSTVDESNLNSKNGFYKIIDSSSHNEHKGKTIRNDIIKNKNGKCK